jgi:RimJ/RimL family protein N-acetyltransferase
MSWFTTGLVDEFLAEAGEFLRAQPARNTVVLTVTEDLRVKGQAGQAQAAQPRAGRAQPENVQPENTLAGSATTWPGHDEPLFGWWRPDAGRPSVRGAFLHTPNFPVFLTSMSSDAASELAAGLAATGRRVPGVNAEAAISATFAAAWQHRTRDVAIVQVRLRLFRLGELVRPDPGPEGAPRLAADRDRDPLITWVDAFVREVGDPVRQDHATAVDTRLSYGGFIVWEAGSVPVSMAGISRAVGGMARVGPVYTPPELRGRGYAGGATLAASQAARDAGAAEVVLYTNLANPTSNALYQRLGYNPVEDRVAVSFQPGT